MEQARNSALESSVVKLDRIDGDSVISERLIDMGFYPGVEIEFISRMVNNGPFILRVQSSFFALREEEVACLKVIAI